MASNLFPASWPEDAYLKKLKMMDSLDKNQTSDTANGVVHIDAAKFINNLLGNNPKQVAKVRCECWDNVANYDSFTFVHISILNATTMENTDIRERLEKFPSPELLAKIELLRIKNE